MAFFKMSVPLRASGNSFGSLEISFSVVTCLFFPIKGMQSLLVLILRSPWWACDSLPSSYANPLTLPLVGLIQQLW